jgi:hypothetical protein
VIALFRQKSPGNVAVLLVFGLLLKLPLFLHPRWITDPASDGWLYTNLIRSFPAGNGPLLAGGLAFLLLYIQALLMNHLVNEYRMTGRQTFLPGMAFLLLTSLVPEWSLLSAPLLAGTLIVWAFHKLFELYNAQSANTRIYNIGLLIGLASFFYFPSVFFGACMLLGFGILRPFRLNEVMLLLLGITTPYYFWAAYLFLTDHFTWAAVTPQLRIGTPRQQPSYWMLASIILIGIPFLMGGFYIQTQLRKMLIQARKNWSIILLFVLLAVFIPFINNQSSYTPWVLTAAPVAAFHACAFLYPGRKWVPGLLFFLMVAFILLQQYGPVFWKK